MSSDLPHRNTGKGCWRRMAETARSVPARPMMRQMSENARMGKGVRVIKGKVEKDFEGLIGLAE